MFFIFAASRVSSRTLDILSGVFGLTAMAPTATSFGMFSVYMLGTLRFKFAFSCCLSRFSMFLLTVTTGGSCLIPSSNMDLQNCLSHIFLFDLTLSFMCPSVHSFLFFCNCCLAKMIN